VITAKHFVEIGTVRLVALGLLLGLPCAYGAAEPADATSQKAPGHVQAHSKKQDKTTHATSAVKKASEKSSIQTAASKGRTSKARKRRVKRLRGQQKIDSGRALAIQQALIREHYLQGEATGKWNQASEDAMRRYQSEHGWQSKTVPDSRALISLGLGPSNDHLLNPESAAISGPNAPRAASLNPESHSAGVATPPAGKAPTAEPTPAATSNQDLVRPQ
jgi:hypothetical protein